MNTTDDKSRTKTTDSCAQSFLEVERVEGSKEGVRGEIRKILSSLWEEGKEGVNYPSSESDLRGSFPIYRRDGRDVCLFYPNTKAWRMVLSPMSLSST